MTADGTVLLKQVCISALCVLAVCASAEAADLPTDHFEPPAPIATPALIPYFAGTEVRFGAYAHDPLSPEGGSADLNIEVLFPKIWHYSDPFWDQFIPHPAVGTTINFVGKTSNFYAGAAWNFRITDRFFVGGEFGPGVNNGKTGNVVPDGHSRIGCNVWFHESATAGYHLTEQWSVMATIEHSSNAGLCVQNRGVTNYGLRLGYLF